MKDTKEKRKTSNGPQITSSGFKKLQAFELKYKGSSYSAISSKLKINQSTLATYFSREWKEEYEKYVEKQNEFIMKLSQQKLRSSLEHAVNTLVELLSSNDERIRFKASVELLDRNLPKDVEPKSRDPVEALLEEYRLMNDGEIIIDDEHFGSSSHRNLQSLHS